MRLLKYTTWLILLVLPIFASLKIELNEPQRKSAYIEGDYMIGALFSVHVNPLRTANVYNPLACGDVLEHKGIQRVEAALFAVESINNDSSLLPGIKLGINIKDDCESESIAVHQVMDFIQRSDQSNNPEDTNIETNTKKQGLLLSVLGPETSSMTAAVQNYMKVFQIFQMGYAATSEEIINALNYYHFISVVPSDYYQSYIIARILQQNKWNYISVAYSTGTYGRMGLHYLENFASSFDICIAAREELFITNTIVESNQAFKNLAHDKVKVIVCFCEKFAIQNLLQSIRRFGLAGQIIIIGSDGWSTNYDIHKGYEEEAVGSLSVGIKTYDLPEFDDYYLAKNFLNNKQNPWFEEFWQKKFDCDINNSSGIFDKPHCKENQTLKQDYVRDPRIYHIVEAINALAHTLHTFVCNNGSNCSKLNSLNSSSFLQTFLNEGLKFKQNHVNLTGWGIPGVINYEIFNFQKLSNQSYRYVKVGQFSGYENKSHHWKYEFPTGNFQLDETLLKFPNGNKTVLSSCSELCSAGFIQKKDKGQESQCCWTCAPCEAGKYQINETACEDCSSETWPSINRTHCEPVPLQHVDYDHLEAKILMAVSTTALIITIFTVFVFVKNKDTPVVKSSTRELCYLILLGMIMAHGVTFAVLAKPTIITCTIGRLILPISFSIIYAALLVKSNRIMRLFTISKRFPNLNLKFMTSEAQIIMTFVLIFAEILICLTTLITESPTPQQIYKIIENQRKGWLVCPNSRKTILTSFSPVAFLVVMCTYYAIKTRHVPRYFNEAKYIGFSMYATCITWVAFGWIHYENVNNYEVVTCCVWAIINALIILCCLFFPKLYTILYVPEKNTRIYYITNKALRCMIGKQDSNQAVSKREFPDKNFIFTSYQLSIKKGICNCNNPLNGTATL